jgi:hypothetical protein
LLRRDLLQYPFDAARVGGGTASAAQHPSRAFFIDNLIARRCGTRHRDGKRLPTSPLRRRVLSPQ